MFMSRMKESSAFAITGQVEIVLYDLSEYLSFPCPINNMHAYTVFISVMSVFSTFSASVVSRR